MLAWLHPRKFPVRAEGRRFLVRGFNYGRAFYRGANCCILVYDVNVGRTFDTLDDRHDDLLRKVINTKWYPPIPGSMYRSTSRSIHGLPTTWRYRRLRVFLPYYYPKLVGRRKKSEKTKEKKREKLEIRHRSPSTILICRRPPLPDVVDETPPLLLVTSDEEKQVIAFGSVPSPAMALGCGTTLKIIILGNRGKGASPNSSSSHLDLSYVCSTSVVVFATFFCRSGILQGRTGFKVSVLHSIEWPTAAFCSMMSMLENHLTLLIPGMMHFLTRYVAPNLVCIKIAEDWCASNSNIPYFGTSAKDDFNIDAAQLALNPDLDM
ncbi:hypothetical protein B296_00005964 [Ensete ventricosum]|uniref:Uncharacterized protein n=1 Tax=Ensete ventricosum TaxID=4639 RepID=A0A427AT04_ENSVE|nr:hypothetical protein B296_00005964 [Ensete ventricosum]